MTAESTLPVLAGGLVLVALSFGAGLLGASLGAPERAADTDPAPRALPDSAVRGRLDELDRRLSNVEERLRVAEDAANRALTWGNDIEELQSAVAELRAAARAAGPVAATEPGGGDAAGGPEAGTAQRSETDVERAERMKRQMREIVERHSHALLRQALLRIADASEQGAADRRSQVYAESKQLATAYAVSAAGEQTLREILTEESEAMVREIAPYLGGGLERADFGQVKGKLSGIWDARDARLREVLDADRYEDYLATRKELRAVYEKALDAMAAERTGGR